MKKKYSLFVSKLKLFLFNALRKPLVSQLIEHLLNAPIFVASLFIREDRKKINYIEPTWSFLSMIGNSPLAKLTILSPFLAKILIATPQPELLETLDFSNVHWLYWSLILFFFGQVVFNIKCPKDIKSYPNAHQNIQTLLQTTTEEMLDTYYFDIYKYSFQQYGGKLQAPKMNLSELMSEVDYNTVKYHDDGRIYTDKHTETIYLNFQKYLDSINYGNAQIIDWKILVAHLSQFRKILDPKSENDSHIEWLVEDAKHWRINENWRINLLRAKYDLENEKHQKSRLWAFTFYFFGSTYFLVHIPLNIFKVLKTYI